MSGAPRDDAGSVPARIWEALRHVEDPELPVSVLGLGLIVSVGYRAPDRTAELQITFTAMGCPASDMLIDDIRQRLLTVAGVREVEIDVVWDPPWSSARLTPSGRDTLQAWGLAV